MGLKINMNKNKRIKKLTHNFKDLNRKEILYILVGVILSLEEATSLNFNDIEELINKIKNDRQRNT